MKGFIGLCFAAWALSGAAAGSSREGDLDLLRQQHTLTDAAFNRAVEEIVASAPRYARVGSIGSSQEGRRITLVTVTDFASGGEEKPAYFIQGHIHSKEMSGTVAALHLLKRLLRDAPDSDLLRKFVFYVVPRCNPDGAERMVRTPGDERSGWGEPTRKPNAFEPCDVNGDGRVTMMRKATPGAGMIAAPNGRGMCGRGKDKEARGYVLMMEGVYHDWDGKFVGRNTPWWREWLDWNRNWPWGWRADQRGAGKAPLCVPEVKLQHDWILAHRNIKASICLHNGWGCVMMPVVADAARKDEVRRLARRAGELCGQWVRYDQTPPPSEGVRMPSSGTFDDWMMNGFGVPCLTVELGTRETSAGVSSAFCFTTKHYPYDNVVEVIEEQKAHPEFGKCIYEWKKAVHPQIGEVEIGGACPSRFACPTAEYLLKVTDGVYAFLVEHARELVAR